jgi:hypothetical protein
MPPFPLNGWSESKALSNIGYFPSGDVTTGDPQIHSEPKIVECGLTHVPAPLKTISKSSGWICG